MNRQEFEKKYLTPWTIVNAILFSCIIGFVIGWYYLAPYFLG